MPSNNQEVADLIQKDLIALLDAETPGAVVGAAPAGGGKTHFVSEVATTLHRGQRLVFICTPTNKQAAELVERLLFMHTPVFHLHGHGNEAALDHVDPWVLSDLSASTSIVDLEGDSVVVSTVAKMADALLRTGLTDDTWPDVLIIDEAYQVKSSDYLKVAELSDVHLLVGDPGQLEPFTTMSEVESLPGRGHPIMDAVSSLLLHHPATPVYRFPLTRRLDDRGARLIRPFYSLQDHEVSSASRPGSRSELYAGTDASVLQAVEAGFSYALLDGDPLHTDTLVTNHIVSVIQTLVREETVLVDDRGDRFLEPRRILVGVSSNDERRMVERALSDSGIQPGGSEGVQVLTANKAQGLEFDVTVVWHPLAGLDSVDEFRLSTGRLCVLLSRHRHMCIVVGMRGDHELLDDIPPETPAIPGVRDQLLQGWFAHEELMETLMDSQVNLSG